MALTVPDEVRPIFLVLTGEEWPEINEDNLRALSQAWDSAAERLSGELAPEMVSVIATIRTKFRGQSERAFADRMAPFVEGSETHIGTATTQFHHLATFLRDLAADVEYVKLVSILSVVALIAELAWAIAMSPFTGGASMVWLAARMAVVRFLLRSLLGRLAIKIAQAQVFGILFQVAIDALAQAVQFGMGTRHQWNTRNTLNAIGIGAVSGLVALPIAKLGKVISTMSTAGLDKLLGKITDGTDWHKILPLVVNEIGVEAAAEVFGEAAYVALTENKWQLNWASGVSGAVSGAVTVAGTGISHLVHAKPIARNATGPSTPDSPAASTGDGTSAPSAGPGSTPPAPAAGLQPDGTAGATANPATAGGDAPPRTANTDPAPAGTLDASPSTTLPAPAAAPNTAAPNTAAPNTTAPGATAPDSTAPDSTAPGSAAASTATPDSTTPDRRSGVATAPTTPHAPAPTAAPTTSAGPRPVTTPTPTTVGATGASSALTPSDPASSPAANPLGGTEHAPAEDRSTEKPGAGGTTPASFTVGPVPGTGTAQTATSAPPSLLGTPTPVTGPVTDTATTDAPTASGIGATPNPAGLTSPSTSGATAPSPTTPNITGTTAPSTTGPTASAVLSSGATTWSPAAAGATAPGTTATSPGTTATTSAASGQATAPTGTSATPTSGKPTAGTGAPTPTTTTPSTTPVSGAPSTSVPVSTPASATATPATGAPVSTSASVTTPAGPTGVPATTTGTQDQAGQPGVSRRDTNKPFGRERTDATPAGTGSAGNALPSTSASTSAPTRVPAPDRATGGTVTSSAVKRMTRSTPAADTSQAQVALDHGPPAPSSERDRRRPAPGAPKRPQSKEATASEDEHRHKRPRWTNPQPEQPDTPQVRAAREQVATTRVERDIAHGELRDIPPNDSRHADATQRLADATAALESAEALLDDLTSGRRKAVIDDEHWRHSDAATSNWSEPLATRVSAAAIAAARTAPTVVVRQAHAETIDPTTLTTDRKTRGDNGIIAHEVRQFTVDGTPVRDLTVRLHLDAVGVDPSLVQEIKDLTRRSVDSFYNGGHRLPSGEQLHVTVEFTDDPGAAHSTVTIADSPEFTKSFQFTWWSQAAEQVYGHEVGHYLGLVDESHDQKSLFRRSASRTAVHTDRGLMTEGFDTPGAGIKPRNLWLIERRGHALTSASTPADPDAGATGTEPGEKSAPWDGGPAYAYASELNAALAKQGSNGKSSEEIWQEIANAAEADLDRQEQDRRYRFGVDDDTAWEMTDTLRSGSSWTQDTVALANQVATDVYGVDPFDRDVVPDRYTRLTNDEPDSDVESVSDSPGPGAPPSTAGHRSRRDRTGGGEHVPAPKRKRKRRRSEEAEPPRKKKPRRPRPPWPQVVPPVVPPADRAAVESAWELLMSARDERNAVYAELRTIPEDDSRYATVASRLADATAALDHAEAQADLLAPGTSTTRAVIDDESWRHSDAATATWSEPLEHRASNEAIELARTVPGVTAVEVSAQYVDPTSESTSRRASGYRGLVAYDMRRFTVGGVAVRDLTVRLHLDAPDTAPPLVEDIKRATLEGVDDYFNRGHRLPSGEQLHVTVEFTDTAETAHHTVAVIEAAERTRSFQDRWWSRAHQQTYAHEIGHYLGLADEYRDSDSFFRTYPDSAEVHHDSAPMTSDFKNFGAEIKPRNLWLIERRGIAVDTRQASRGVDDDVVVTDDLEPDEELPAQNGGPGYAYASELVAALERAGGVPDELVNTQAVWDQLADALDDDRALPAGERLYLTGLDDTAAYETAELVRWGSDWTYETVSLAHQVATKLYHVDPFDGDVVPERYERLAPEKSDDEGDDDPDAPAEPPASTAVRFANLFTVATSRRDPDAERLSASQFWDELAQWLEQDLDQPPGAPRYVADDLTAALLADQIRNGDAWDAATTDLARRLTLDAFGVDPFEGLPDLDSQQAHLDDAAAAVEVARQSRDAAFRDVLTADRTSDSATEARNRLVRASAELDRAQADADLVADAYGARPGTASVIDDESWRHSDAVTADWARPLLPVSNTEIMAGRAEAAPQRHRALRFEAFTESTPGQHPGFSGRLAYDLRRFSVDGTPVRDLTIRLFLDAPDGVDPARLEALRQRTRQGVDRFYNQGHRLPSGEQLHVTVEFTDSTEKAHERVTVVDGAQRVRSNQLSWWIDETSHAYAHEIGHFLGLTDEYVDPRVLFRDDEAAMSVHTDIAPMNDNYLNADVEIKPRNLWMIEKLSADSARSASDDTTGTRAGDDSDPPLTNDTVTDPAGTGRARGFASRLAVAAGEQGRTDVPATAGALWQALADRLDADLRAPADHRMFLKGLTDVQHGLVAGIVRRGERWTPLTVDLANELSRDLYGVTTDAATAATANWRGRPPRADVPAEEAAARHERAVNDPRGRRVWRPRQVAEQAAANPVTRFGTTAESATQPTGDVPPDAPKRQQEDDGQGPGQAGPSTARFRPGPTNAMPTATELRGTAAAARAERLAALDQLRSAPPGTSEHNAARALMAGATAALERVETLADLLAPTRAVRAVIDDESWWHSEATTSDWSAPLMEGVRASSADIRAERRRLIDHNAPVSWVDTTYLDPGAWSSPRLIAGFDVEISHDVRRFEVNGVPVRDYTVRIALDVPEGIAPERVQQLVERTHQGVEQIYNQGHRLPSGDQLHVTVEFIEDALNAHGEVLVLDIEEVSLSRQDRWGTNEHPVVLAHEVGHYLGLIDEYHDARSAFRQTRRSDAFYADDSLMNEQKLEPGVALLPRHLWQIERRGLGTLSIAGEAVDLPLVEDDSSSDEGPEILPPNPIPARIFASLVNLERGAVLGGTSQSIGSVRIWDDLHEALLEDLDRPRGERWYLPDASDTALRVLLENVRTGRDWDLRTIEMARRVSSAVLGVDPFHERPVPETLFDTHADHQAAQRVREALRAAGPETSGNGPAQAPPVLDSDDLLAINLRHLERDLERMMNDAEAGDPVESDAAVIARQEEVVADVRRLGQAFAEARAEADRTSRERNSGIEAFEERRDSLPTYAARLQDEVLQQLVQRVDETRQADDDAQQRLEDARKELREAVRVLRSLPRAERPVTQPGALLDDLSWLRSDALTAEWSRPLAPVSAEAIAAHRQSTSPTEVKAIFLDPKNTGTPHEAHTWQTLAGFDLRRFEVDGVPVRDHTVRIHLQAPDGLEPARVAGVRERTVAAVDELYNQGYRLPSGDQFHVTVEFTDTAESAHHSVELAVADREIRSHELLWWVDGEGVLFAHELGHMLGLGDEYRDTAAALRAKSFSGAVLENSTLMGDHRQPGAQILPRHLFQIELRSAQALADVRRLGAPLDEPQPPRHQVIAGAVAFVSHLRVRAAELGITVPDSEQVWADIGAELHADLELHRRDRRFAYPLTEQPDQQELWVEAVATGGSWDLTSVDAARRISRAKYGVDPFDGPTPQAFDTWLTDTSALHGQSSASQAGPALPEPEPEPAAAPRVSDVDISRDVRPVPGEQLVPPSAQETAALLAAVPHGARFTDFERWLPLVNGDREQSSRKINAVDAALAFHETYHGAPRAAGAPVGAELRHAPEHLGTGAPALAEVVDRVTAAGHGADAVVFTFPSDGGTARAWNVVNHHGTVSLVDAQAGTSRPAADAVPDGLGRVYAIPIGPDGDYLARPRATPAVSPELGPEVLAEHERTTESPEPDWESYAEFINGQREKAAPNRLAALTMHLRDVNTRRMLDAIEAGLASPVHGTPGWLEPGVGGLRLVGAIVDLTVAADLAVVLGRDIIAVVIAGGGEEPRELRIPPKGRPLPVMA